MPIKLLGSTSGYLILDAPAIANNATLTLPQSANGAFITTGDINTFTRPQIIEATDNSTAALRITQLGTAYAIRVDDSANPDSTPFVVTATGTIGVGTENPTSSVDIVSSSSDGNSPTLTIRNTSGVTPGFYGPTIKLSNGVSGKHGYIINQEQSSGSSFQISNPDSPYDRYFVIDQSGNVGIGATTPTGKFSVNSTNQYAGISLTGSGRTWQVGSNSTSLVTMNFQHDALAFANYGSEIMRIDYSGKVGIGVTPTDKLHVAGIIKSKTSTDASLIAEAGTGTAALAAVSNSRYWRWLTSNSDNALRLNDETAGVERMRIDSAGQVGIGIGTSTGTTLLVNKNITGGLNSFGALLNGVVQSDVTSSATYFRTTASTAAASFTCASLYHFRSAQGTFGYSSSVTTQIGFFSDSSLIGATNNFAFRAENTAAVGAGKTAYGYYTNINTATGGGTTYGFYAAGTAQNYFGGNVGIGTSSPNTRLNISGGSLASSGGGVSIAGLLSTGRIFSGGGATVNSLHTYLDSEAYEISAGSTSGYVTGIGIASRNYTGTYGDALTFFTRSAERVRITSGGRLLVNTTTDDPVGTNSSGTAIVSGVIITTANNDVPLYVNRKASDGVVISIKQDGTQEGSISVSGTTVSYNSFAGSHLSQLSDNTRPDILCGTVVETIDEKCVWPNEDNDQLAKFKVSDTVASKRVYGVFMSWDNDDLENNDAYITGLGAYLVRIAAGVTVEGGDLLESNGDGCARVQDDDVIRSKTIGKVTSNIPTHTYDDGSYTVPCVLYCG